jgi:hypothetical protein
MNKEKTANVMRNLIAPAFQLTTHISPVTFHVFR